MILLDTNILIYSINKSDPSHEAAVAYVESLLSGIDMWCLTWINVYEFMSIVTHSRFPSPLAPNAAWSLLGQFISHPNCRFLTESDRHFEVLESVLKEIGPARGGFYHDCHIAALMKEHGVSKIATADTGFRKFRFLKIVDPTR